MHHTGRPASPGGFVGPDLQPVPAPEGDRSRRIHGSPSATSAFTDAKSAGYSLWRSASRSSAVRFASRACRLPDCNCFRLLLCTAVPFKFGGLTLRLR